MNAGLGFLIWVGVLGVATSGPPGVGAKHVHNRTDIYFAAFFPMTPKNSPEGLIGHGVMPAVRLAIKHINQSPNILKGFKLHMYWNDTQVCFFKKFSVVFLYFVHD